MTGDLRSVQNGEKIVKEAVRMGFERIILPQKNVNRISGLGGEIRLIGIKSLAEAIKVI